MHKIICLCRFWFVQLFLFFYNQNIAKCQLHCLDKQNCWEKEEKKGIEVRGEQKVVTQFKRRRVD